MKEVIISLLMAHAAPDAVQTNKLAAAIIAVSAQYNVDAIQLTQLILTESRGRAGAYNARTQDYGLMQINIKTAAAYGLTPACLTNWRCNLEAGARILSELNRLCQYNVGTGTLVGTRMERCLKYESKVASFAVGAL